MSRTIITYFAFLFCVSEANAQKVIMLSDTMPSKWIGQSISYLKDPEERLSFDQIREPGYDRLFVPCEQEVPNFGNVQLTIWNKLIVVNRSSKNWILSEMNDSDTLTFYYKDSSGVYRQIVMGVSRPVSVRKYKTNVFAFDLPVKYGDTALFYLKVQTRNCEYPLQISSYENFIADLSKRDLLKGFYYGVVMLIIIYNTTLLILLKDRTYVYYILYVIFTALLMSVLSGIYPLLLGDRLHFLWDAGPAITALAIIFFFLFTRSFLEIKNYAPQVNKVINYFFMPSLYSVIFLNLINQSLIASVLNQVIGLLSLSFILGVAVYVFRKGFKPARFYILACAFYSAGVLIYILKTFAILPYNYFTTNAMELSSAFEMIMFSVSLGDRLYLERKEKANAQQELISSFREKARLQYERLELEAKALRAQMNPHFVYNCMNSIKSLIQKKEEEKAINYLTTFSKLLRTVLNNSDKHQITLFDELETCRLYAQLEAARFEHKLVVNFKIDDGIDLKSVLVPPLIIQPYIENAIWHGIMPREERGKLQVIVEKKNGLILCIVDDDGIGRDVSIQNKFKKDKAPHSSRGMGLTQSRLDVENALRENDAAIEVIDKKNVDSQSDGTTVIIKFKVE